MENLYKQLVKVIEPCRGISVHMPQETEWNTLGKTNKTCLYLELFSLSPLWLSDSSFLLYLPWGD